MNIEKRKPKRQSDVAKPIVLIAMGVSGCGKSSFAQRLARELNISVLDADDFHSEENKARMASGQPLTDAMRQPWVHALQDKLSLDAIAGKSNVLAFSGLRREHRNTLRITNAKVVFFFLNGSKSLIADRLNKREEHFMPSSLLDSQFEALEEPVGEGDVEELDISESLENLVNQAIALLKKRNFI